MKKENGLFIVAFVVCIGVFGSFFSLSPSLSDRLEVVQSCLGPWLDQAKQNLHQKTLSNGLTMLVYEKKDTPDVHLRITYRVGSKDERPEQFGFAHMVEHMIFKGTQKLAEPDIFRLSRAFCRGGSCNAFTSYDTTCYHFDTDKNHWPIFVEVLADCMENARFDEGHFASEVKAVFQEIKERNDDGVSNLFGMLLPQNHPYSHPIVGYKENLLAAQAADLRAFFKENYAPDKAALIVVGNVDAALLFEKAESCFGHIPSPERLVEDSDLGSFVPRQKELFSKHVTVYQPVENPCVQYIWALPGYSSLEHEAVKVLLAHVLNKRLSRILVDELKYVYGVSVGCSSYLLENLFSIKFSPKDGQALLGLEGASSLDQIIDRCQHVIRQEIASIVEHGIREDEKECILLQLQSDDVRSFLPVESIASMLHDLFLKQEPYDTLCQSMHALHMVTDEQIKEFARVYLRVRLQQSISTLPIPEDEKDNQAILQQLVDDHDARVLAQQSRQVTKSLPISMFDLPDPIMLSDTVQKPAIDCVLANGLRVIIVHQAQTPFVCAWLGLNNRIHLSRLYAIQNKPDIPGLAMQLLGEGTKKYSKKELQDFSQIYAAHIRSSLHGVCWESLPCDIKVVSSRIKHVLTQPLLPPEALEKEKSEMLALIDMNQEHAGAQLNRLIQDFFYHEYPWVTTDIQIKKSQVQAISREDLRTFIHDYVHPENMTLIMVGNVDLATIKEDIVKIWGSWRSGKKLEPSKPILAPSITNPSPQDLHAELPKDQVHLVAARLTVNAHDEDALALKMLDQYMSARLFEVREKTGIFYGSGACLDPAGGDTVSLGHLSMMVLPSNVRHAKLLIKDMLARFAQEGLTREEYMFAKHRLSSDYAQSIADANSLLSHYAHCLEYGYDWHYAEDRLARIQELSYEKVQEIARKYCTPDDWSFFTVGRSVTSDSVS